MVFTQELSFSYSAECIPAPNLIQTLTGESGSVQLYYKEKVSRKSVLQEKAFTPVKVQSVRIPSSSVDLDITGSPLKAGFDPNEVFDDSIDDLNFVRKTSKSPVYSGLPVKFSRTLLSRINVNLTLSSSGSNYILCSSEDKSNLLYLGNKIENGNLTHVSKTRWEGPLPCKSMSGALESFNKNHSAAAGRSRIQVQSRAEYLLTGEEGDGFLILDCSWERSGSFLESPPPDALSKLKVCLIPGDRRFACDNQNSDIEQLEGLVSGLVGEGLVWSGRDGDTSLEEEILEVLESSRKLKPSLGPQDEESENVLALQSRQDVDITDMLWTVLSRSESFAELTDLLTLVFETVLREEIRPFIYSGNRSGMAGMLRDVVRSGTIPDLSGSKPLSLLIEMGIEKLKRDSSQFLLSSDLATKESLDPYLSGESLTESLDLIKRLHLVVELAFACQTYVNLPSSSLKTLVHSALLQLRKVEALNKVQLEFPIQTSDVKNQLENGKAGFWQIKLESEDVTSVAQLQIEKPSEIHPAPTGSVLEDELEPEMKIRKSGKAAKVKPQDSPVFKLNKGGVSKKKNKKDKNGAPQGRVVKTGAVSKLRKDGSRKVLQSLDKVINTPTGTKSLIYSDDSDTETKKKMSQKSKKMKMKKVKEESDKPEEKDITEPENGSENLDLNGPGGLLRKGLKFKSQDSFLRFINMPVKGAKGKKRKVEETNLRDTADLEGVENPAFENSVLEDEDSLKTPNRKDSKFHSLQFA